MRVIINTTTYNVKFSHYQNKVKHSFTECKITINEKQFIGVGCAIVHPKDNFCKEKGRQISLTKALNNLKFEREDRTIFWNEYRKWGKIRF